jgi:flagellar basal-body rod protein FlgG
MLVNADGLPLTPQIEIPENALKVAIGSDGTVSATVPGQQNSVELGRITLTNFTNPAGLEALGGNLYRATSASGEPQEGVPGEEASAHSSSTRWKAPTSTWWRRWST